MKFGNLKKQATSFLDNYKNENPATYAAAQQAIGGLLIVDGFIGIDNPFGDKKRPGIFGALIGIAVGVLFIFIPTIFNGFTGLNKLTATTNATVVSVTPHQSSSTNSNGTQQTSTVCSVVAEYTVNAMQYSQASFSESSSMCSLAAGQTTQINYNPDSPGQWSSDVKTTSAVLTIFPIVGVLVAIASFVTFVIRLLSIIFGWKLLRSGRALANTLPQGVDLSVVIKQIEHSFKTTIFGFNDGQQQPPAQSTPQPPASNEGQRPQQ